MFRGTAAPWKWATCSWCPRAVLIPAPALATQRFAKARVIIWEDVEAEFGDQKLEQNLLAVG